MSKCVGAGVRDRAGLGGAGRGFSYRHGELGVVKEQAVGFGHVTNAPCKGRKGEKGRERRGGDRTDENG